MQLINYAYFVDLSRKRPPCCAPKSDHFVVPQGWSLTRELTVVKFLILWFSVLKTAL